MIKSKIKYIFIIVILLVFLLFCINVIMNNIFYNPYKNYATNAKAITYTTQLLCPTISFVYASEYDPPHYFSKFTQEIYFKRYSQLYDINHNVCNAKINYKFGNAKSESFGKFPLQKSIKNQSYYNGNMIGKYNNIINNSKSSDYYDIYIGFNKPTPLNITMQYISKMFKESDCKDKKFGVRWIPILTSDKASDITIGIRGNLSWTDIGALQGQALTNQFIDNDYYEQENYFISSIKFLINNPIDTDIIIESGLFGKIGNINFKERLNYINKNGINAMGIVIYTNVDNMKKLKVEDYKIINIEKDAVQY